jgi:hypothetical protein
MFRILTLVLLLSPVTFAQSLPDLTVPDALGVNIHFTTAKPGEMRMLADAGFKWVRMDFTWAATERKKGVYDFSRYDTLLQSLAPHDIRPLFILDYANRLYDDGLPPHTDIARAAMAKWAAAAATHFKGKGVIWEMWNEPNIAQFWKPKPNADNYAKLALAVAKAVRAADPTSLHVGPATSTIDLAFLETCFKAGLLDHWDAVSVHPYRQGDPETANPEYRNLRLLIARYAPKGKTIPILSGEWGYSAAWKNFDEARQAKYLPRQLLTNLYNEVPISIWYDWHDDGPDPKEPEHHFGTVRHPYTKGQSPVYDPKPAYLAMKTLTEQLGGYTYNKRLAMPRDQDYVLLFSHDDQVRLAAWTTSRSPHDVTIPSSAGKFKVVRADGRPGPQAEAGERGLVLKLEDTVQYLIPADPNQILTTAARWARVPLELQVEAPQFVPIPADDGDKPPVVTKTGGHGIRGQSSGTFMNVQRATPPTTQPARLWVKNFGAIEQRTLVLVTNPLCLQPIPVLGDALPIQISNESGEAFEGDLRLDRTEGLRLTGKRTLRIKIAAGERVATASFLATPTATSYSVAFALRRPIDSDRLGLLIQDISARFAIVSAGVVDAPEPATNKLRVAPDGDPAVRSSADLMVAQAPPGLPVASQPAFKLTYSFSPGWKFLQLKPATDALKTITGRPKELALWLHGDASNHRVRLRYTDATGQTFQPSGPKIDWKGWRYITIPLAGPDLAHWGGRNDGEIHHPIKWDTLFLLDNESRETSAGEIWITSPTLIK